MIDWTKPVETAEDPPRPVRVLFDSEKNFSNIVKVGPVVYVLYHQDLFARVGQPDDRIALRNVPPPKSEPVLYEKWVLLWDNGQMSGDYTSWRSVPTVDGAKPYRIAWMSDGSPVPVSPEQFDQMREMATLIQDRDHWKTRAEALQAEVERLQEVEREWVRVHHHENKVAHDLLDEARQQRDEYKAEVDRLKPVVEAAVVWCRWYERNFATNVGAVTSLIEAVRSYLSQQAPDDPVKSCTTCRFSHIYHADEPCNVCADNSRRKPFKSYWEPRHD